MRSIVLASIVVLGCGDSTTAETDSGTPPPGDGPAGDQATGPIDNGVEFDEVYEAEDCARAPTCTAAQLSTACTCINRPLEDGAFATTRTTCARLPTEMGRPRTFEDDFCGEAGAGTGADIECFMPGMTRTAGTPMMVSVHGVVDVFGNGGDADAILVEIYREGMNGAMGELVGMATASTTSPCKETEDEIDRDMVIGQRELGYYRIENVPTETPLIVKTSGSANIWKPLYTYNVVFFNEEVVATPPEAGSCADLPTGARVEYRARTLSRSDYATIPQTAGLPAGIAMGNGAVAGEVHDCGDVRLEFAQVGTNPAARALVYFNDSPSNPLPQLSRTEGTSLLGLYAALDLPAGPVNVAAAGRVDGRVVSLGWYRAQVFAGAVSVVTLRGLRAPGP